MNLKQNENYFKVIQFGVVLYSIDLAIQVLRDEMQVIFCMNNKHTCIYIYFDNN